MGRNEAYCHVKSKFHNLSIACRYLFDGMPGNCDSYFGVVLARELTHTHITYILPYISITTDGDMLRVQLMMPLHKSSIPQFRLININRICSVKTYSPSLLLSTLILMMTHRHRHNRMPSGQHRHPKYIGRQFALPAISIFGFVLRANHFENLLWIVPCSHPCYGRPTAMQHQRHITTKTEQ